MSLTHPSPFDFRAVPLQGDWSDIYSASAARQRKSEAIEKRRNSGEVSQFLATTANFQPPHFRVPKPVKVVREARAPAPMPEPKRVVRTTSATGQLRLLLAQHGPMTRSEIAWRASMEPQKVGDILKQCKHVRLDKSTYPQRYYVAANPPAGVVA